MSDEGLDDDRMAARIRAGDDRAFGGVFEAHYANLVGFAESFLGSHEDAEEVVCDLFATLYERRATWDPHGSIRAYLFRAVRNRVTNLRRDRQRVDAKIAAFVADEVEDDERVVALSADAALLASEDTAVRRAALERVMAELPSRAREVVALRWGEGMSDDMIAEVLETTVAAVRMQASRALKVLRERLPGYLR